jgi:hypothetical protein
MTPIGDCVYPDCKCPDANRECSVEQVLAAKKRADEIERLREALMMLTKAESQWVRDIARLALNPSS